MKERLKNNKGFTLVEIIVVLVIIAILAAIAVPAVLGYVDESKKTRYIITHIYKISNNPTFFS